MAFFTELEYTVLKFVWKHKKPQIVEIIIRKKNKAGSAINPNFNYTAKLQQLKEYRTGTKNDTWINGTEDLKNEPPFIWAVYSGKRRQEYSIGKNNLCNKWCSENGHLHAKILN